MCNDPAEVLVTWCCLCAPVSAHTTTTTSSSSSSSSSSSLSCLIWTVWAGESVPQSERVHLLSGARVSWQRLGPVRCFFTLKKKKKKSLTLALQAREGCVRVLGNGLAFKYLCPHSPDARPGIYLSRVIWAIGGRTHGPSAAVWTRHVAADCYRTVKGWHR